ncbi:nicotinate-nucleotide--dimethylbenzimidazole phosphoribosyltransferase [Desulfothermobacter acidiphilus]|uniref:nicotinate-nucleotide--dimethylbenzimidazole phosphoribosyltransferase n=1 Tax=Desulfothermobacter acidiphilus TaxID=1938353 RepID=UPI003F8911E5
MERLIAEICARVGDLDKEAMAQAQDRLDQLLKPPGSLGRLEELAVQLAGIMGTPRPVIRDKCVVVMAGDHGVVEEGVSAAPQEITYQILPHFVRGTSGIGVLARHAGARVLVVDVGVACPVSFPGVLVRKVRAGTGNIARGPAMSREEALRAIQVGVEVAAEEVRKGASLIATGDMGIGNTTPSSAILAAFTGLPVEETVGRGTLVNDAVLQRKREVVAQSLAVNRPDPSDPLDVLAKVGGLEIAGLVGLILGAAAHRVPVLLDGFITGAAALVAAGLCFPVRQFLIASHLSRERAHHHMLRYLGLKPLLDFDLRLGEGTGAALALPLVEASCEILNKMVTFSEAAVMSMHEDKIWRP